VRHDRSFWLRDVWGRWWSAAGRLVEQQREQRPRGEPQQEQSGQLEQQQRLPLRPIALPEGVPAGMLPVGAPGEREIGSACLEGERRLPPPGGPSVGRQANTEEPGSLAQRVSRSRAIATGFILLEAFH
jgi:hypothetical protein